MKGIVIHCQGRLLRCLQGRVNEGQLTVKAVMPVPAAREANAGPGAVPPRPVRFVFYYGDRVYASSRKVILAKGRRYPGVEHWFVCPDRRPEVIVSESQMESAAPV